MLSTVVACVEQSEGLHWQSVFFGEGSGETGLLLIYNVFDPIRPMSTFVSTAQGNVYVCVCVYVLQRDRKNERQRGREGRGDDTGGFQGHCRAGF